MRDSRPRSLNSRAGALWRALRLLAALSLLATAFVLLARVHWFFELFSHFRVQLLAVELLMMMAFLVMRRPLWAIVLGVASVNSGAPIREYLLPVAQPMAAVATNAADEGAPVPASQRPAQELPAEIRVLTANVLASNTDATAFIEVVRAAEPDVFAVLELREPFAEALHVLEKEYPHRVLAPDPGLFGIGVYSRLPLADSDVFELNGFAAIDIRLGAGDSAWHFVAVHLLSPRTPEMAAGRNAQLSALAQRVLALKAPSIVAGDFNSTPWSPYFADFVAATGLQNALRGFGPGYTWPSFFPLLGIPIDHVLVSTDFQVVDYFRGGDIGSDHFPIIVDMNRRQLGLD